MVQLHARHGAVQGADLPPFSAAERLETTNLTGLAERFSEAVLEFEGAMEKLRKVGADFSSILQTSPGPLMNPPVKFKDIDFEDDDCRNDYGLEQEHIVTNPEKYSPEEIATAKVNLAEFIEATGGYQLAGGFDGQRDRRHLGGYFWHGNQAEAAAGSAAPTWPRAAPASQAEIPTKQAARPKKTTALDISLLLGIQLKGLQLGLGTRFQLGKTRDDWRMPDRQNKKILCFIDEYGTAGKSGFALGCLLVWAHKCGRVDKAFSDLLDRKVNEVHASELSDGYLQGLMAKFASFEGFNDLVLLNKSGDSYSGTPPEIYAQAVIETAKVGIRQFRVVNQFSKTTIRNVDLLLDANGQNTHADFERKIECAIQDDGLFKAVNRVVAINSAASRLLQIADVVAYTRSWISRGKCTADELHRKYKILTP